MGGQCCQPQHTELSFDNSKYKGKEENVIYEIKIQPIKQLKIIKKSHLPSPQFAQITQLPDLADPVKTTIRNLPPLHYSKQQQHNSDHQQLPPYKLSNGIIYYGKWKQGLMNGEGKYYLVNGSYVEGYSVDGVLSGNGRVIQQNGNYYEGPILNNQASGKGVYHGVNYKYVGEFHKNLKHGEGQQQGENYIFKGMFEYGEKVKGQLIWGKQQLDHKYIGEIKQNKPSRWGELRNQIGVYQGEFKNGMKNGEGKFKWKDGHMYIGSYLNDKKHGKGIFFDPQGKQIKNCQWKDDAPI